MRERWVRGTRAARARLAHMVDSRRARAHAGTHERTLHKRIAHLRHGSCWGLRTIRGGAWPRAHPV